MLFHDFSLLIACISTLDDSEVLEMTMVSRIQDLEFEQGQKSTFMVFLLAIKNISSIDSIS